MRPISPSLGAAVLLLFASGAGASTLVDLICGAEVLQTGDYNETAGTLELLIRIEGVDIEASATDCFADGFMEYHGNSETTILVTGLSPEEAGMIAQGSMIDLNYFSVSGICLDEDGEPKVYSSTRWTLVNTSAPHMCLSASSDPPII